MSAEPPRRRRRGTPISDGLGADLQALCRELQLRGWSRLRQSDLLAFVRQHRQPPPAPESVIHASEASRTERLFLLLLDHLGVAPEALQAAWRGEDDGGG
jgi:hypothetical protein